MDMTHTRFTKPSRYTFALLVTLVACAGVVGPPASAQDGRDWVSERAWIVPQHSSGTAAARNGIEVTRVLVEVAVVDRVATTTMEVQLRNRTARRQEAELLLPVPDDIVPRGFEFAGQASLPSARLLPRDEAKRLYESIVAKTRDPALLEFLGENAIRSSVFPVEANQEQRIRVTYEQLLPADGDRLDLVIPRSESLSYRVPWTIHVRWQSTQELSTLYSPSHELVTRFPTDRRVAEVSVSEQALSQPGSFRLSALRQRSEVSASLVAYPDVKNGGGYFLLLVGLPDSKPSPTDGGHRTRRDVTLVLDRSGSMSGPKLEQAKGAALQILEGLEPGETFNIIPYNEGVESFAAKPVVKNADTLAAARRYVHAILPRGGTNIHDALVAGLAEPAPTGSIPIVLFLTDGLPTIGRTREMDLRQLAQSTGNPHGKRIFTFGVGWDVNSPLLENLAYESRGVATFVLPDEDLELKVASVFRRLSGPVLATPTLQPLDASGKPAPGRVMDLLPTRLPDLFQNDQLVLLGRYVGSEPLSFELDGVSDGERRSFRFQFELNQASSRSHFVPRLWAGRKIGVLNDAIRSVGASPAEAPRDPRFRELVEEIVRLSTEHGILSEYTAFLAEEGTDMSRRGLVQSLAEKNFHERAVATRSGAGAISQDLNAIRQKNLSCLNIRNTFQMNGQQGDQLQLVELSGVQQVADKAFFRRGEAWWESTLAGQAGSRRADRTIAFGSPEYFALAEKLVAEGRQAILALVGEIWLQVDGQTVLVTGAAK